MTEVEPAAVSRLELSALIGRADIGLAVVDPNGVFRAVNEALARQLDSSVGLLEGRGAGLLLGRAMARFELADPLGGEQSWSTRRIIETPEETLRALDVVMVDFADPAGLTAGHLLVTTEVPDVAPPQSSSHNDMFRTLLDQSPDAVLVVCDGIVEFANPQAGNLFECSSGDLVGTGIASWLPAAAAEAIASDHEATFETAITTGRRGEVHFAVKSRSCMFGCDPGHQIVLDDITDQKRTEAQLLHDASHDPLTGLPNRTLLFDRIEGAMARRRRHGGLCGVMVVDLDRFKEVNDSFGHAAGDDILVAVTSRLLEVVRPTDTVSRLGGDEFVVVCEVMMADEARAIAERIVRGLEQPVSLRTGEAASVGASVGLALASGEVDAASVLEHADQVMFEAKRGGRGGWRQATVRADGLLDHG